MPLIEYCLRSYSYPIKFRQRMSKAWDVDVDEWWLPDGEGQTDILRQIRIFVEDRKREKSDHLSRELANMNGIFAALKLNDDKSSEDNADEESDESDDDDMN